jgi:hypothetical protein
MMRKEAKQARKKAKVSVSPAAPSPHVRGRTKRDPSWCVDLLKKECRKHVSKGTTCAKCAHAHPEIDSNCVFGSIHDYCYQTTSKPSEPTSQQAQALGRFNQACDKNGDCASSACVNGKCAAPT